MNARQGLDNGGAKFHEDMSLTDEGAQRSESILTQPRGLQLESFGFVVMIYGFERAA